MRLNYPYFFQGLKYMFSFKTSPSLVFSHLEIEFCLTLLLLDN